MVCKKTALPLTEWPARTAGARRGLTSFSKTKATHLGSASDTCVPTLYLLTSTVDVRKNLGKGSEEGEE